jgi:TolB-like protein
VNQSSKGVFLSYASEDAGAAKRICGALRVAGIEVWFDQSELRGGDAWDQKIRQQIRDCAMFVAIISTHTQARPEGYFRLEWKLAVDRSHLMAAEKAFLVPVVVDATPEPEALVPAQFREVQWTRIQDDEVQATFVERIAALLNQRVAARVGTPERGVSRAPPRRLPVVLIALCVAAVVAFVIATAIRGGWLSHKTVSKGEDSTASASVTTTPAVIPEKSVAVLPFVDMSEKKDQEYFSDGLSEELIDMLSKVPDLRVPARTSSFYFKGKQTTIADIAKALSVAHVLEGSVRKSGNRLRITVQLIRVDNGYHVWSETYDRKLDDIFKVQDAIAGAVVQALKVSLLSGEQVSATVTSNTEAYSLYLQARSFKQQGTSLGYQKCIDYLRRAVTLDPSFAPAWAALAPAHISQYGFFQDQDRTYHDYRATAFTAAQTALKLDPGLAEAHLAMAEIFYNLDWDWEAAGRELRLVLAADPRNADALRTAARLANTRGDYREAQGFAERAISIDPVNFRNYGSLAGANLGLGNLEQAASALRKALELNPGGAIVHYWLASVLLVQGKSTEAFNTIQNDLDPKFRDSGLALIVDTNEHRGEADRALAELQTRYASSSAYQIAHAYAVRHDLDKTFAWLDRAYRQHDGGLLSLSYMFGPDVRADPRFMDLLRKMNLPE